MSPTPARALRTSLVTLAIGLAGCAHLPRSSEAALAVGAPADAPDAAAAQGSARVLVTGSRIPRRVSARTGLPETFSPVHVYTRHDVVRAGPPGELGVALYRLDPAFGR